MAMQTVQPKEYWDGWDAHADGLGRSDNAKFNEGWYARASWKAREDGEARKELDAKMERQFQANLRFWQSHAGPYGERPGHHPYGEWSDRFLGRDYWSEY